MEEDPYLKKYVKWSKCGVVIYPKYFFNINLIQIEIRNKIIYEKVNLCLCENISDRRVRK